MLGDLTQLKGFPITIEAVAGYAAYVLLLILVSIIAYVLGSLIPSQIVVELMKSFAIVSMLMALAVAELVPIEYLGIIGGTLPIGIIVAIFVMTLVVYAATKLAPKLDRSE